MPIQYQTRDEAESSKTTKFMSKAFKPVLDPFRGGKTFRSAVNSNKYP